MDISSFIKSIIQADLQKPIPVSDLEIIKTGDELKGRVIDIQNDGKVMVDFGKFKVAAEFQFPISKGDTLTVRVDELGKQIKMKIIDLDSNLWAKKSPFNLPSDDSTRNRTIFDTRPQGSIPVIKSLKPGVELQGRVEGVQKDGKVLIKFGNFKAIADIKFPVSQGEILHTKITETGEGFKMQLTGPESKLQVFSKGPLNHFTSMPPETINNFKSEITNILFKNDLFSKSNPIPQQVKQAFQAVQSFLDPIIPDDQIEKMTPKLKSQAEDSGLLFEKKLEKALLQLPKSAGELSPGKTAELPAVKRIMSLDLKPNLFIIKEFIDNQETALKYMDSKQHETIRNMVERLIGNMDDQQAKAIIRQQEPDQTLFFTHMLYLKEEGLKSRLRVYYTRKKKGDSKTGTRISLLLSLDKLGEIRSDLFLMEKGLNINFYVANLKTESLLNENMKMINQALSSNFHPLSIKVMRSEEKVREFDQEELFIADDQKINIRA